ncbi:hypothetical protein CEXT_187151 [Caerostris extrusa]|uniref:Uncharacterized protein n=1 Tax=Caerostris extrusa TaxID=172846 RepID=A0AAV4PG94_CAEEX|nr:hypothetical protein CEXT_187151 [Caerostris extrusa]
MWIWSFELALKTRFCSCYKPVLDGSSLSFNWDIINHFHQNERWISKEDSAGEKMSYLRTGFHCQCHVSEGFMVNVRKGRLQRIREDAISREQQTSRRAR